MFKKMQRFMFVISGSAAALFTLYLLRQRGTGKLQPIVKETQIKVDEVPGENVTEMNDVPASPSVPEKQAPVKKSTKKAVVDHDVQPDDLKRIEGIGPKTASILNDAGISSFQALADLKSEEIKDILRAANGRGVPTSWPQQAKLAAVEDWDGLAKLQSELKGGL